MDLAGHLAVAVEGGAGLGVVVIPAGWHLTPHVRAVCDRLVSEGFTAFVPDLPAPDADVGDLARTLSGAVDLLVAHEAVRGDGVGVVGFSDGGAALALWLATVQPESVRAVVPFYGLPSVGSEPDWTVLEAAVEGHFAGADGPTDTTSAEAFEERLTDLGKDVRVFTYPGARQGFFDDTNSDTYDAEAARQAWVRTLEFLRAKLG